jgi:hypothetical protein
MVLRLKTRKSRSLPGLRKTDKTFRYDVIQKHKPADAEMRGGLCCFMVLFWEIGTPKRLDPELFCFLIPNKLIGNPP